VTDTLTPIPAEGTWSGDPADLPNWDAMPRRNRRRKRRGHYPIWLKYLAWVVVLAMLVTAAQIAYHAIRSDPRDATLYATRQLRFSVIRPDERPVVMVKVSQRPAIDYFRATRGLLVLTNQRLLYLGLQPRDLLASGDAPPTFEQRDFAVDTLVHLAPGRTFFQIAKAVVVRTPGGSMKLGVPSGAWPNADTLMHKLDSRYAAVYAEGRRQGALRRAREQELRSARVASQRPVRFLVKPRDAVSTIATQWNTTPDRIREWNGLVRDRIRVGEGLIVRK